MMKIPLEDNYLDVIGKAQRGLGLSDEALASKAGLSLSTLENLKKGSPFDDQLLHSVSDALSLNASALIILARNGWEPSPIQVKGLVAFNTPFRDVTVNNYLIGDSETKRAMVFDTGTTVQPVLTALSENGWTLEAIFLTHTHGDHILELDLLKEKTHAPAYANERESIAGTETFSAGKIFSVGNLKIHTRLTTGHSKGGTTYLVQGLQRPLAVVGDAVFACSMGGGIHSYEQALRTNYTEIYSLPPETVLCPGHGPLTTVEDEKKHNPFYVEKAV